MTTTKDKPAAAAIKDLLSQSPDGLREIVRAVMQEMLEAEMTDALQAETGERTPERMGYRSGSYGLTLITRVGKLELRVPQDRGGRFSTELFERYQRSERALVATGGHRLGRAPPDPGCRDGQPREPLGVAGLPRRTEGTRPQGRRTGRLR